MIARYRCLLCSGRWVKGGQEAWKEHYRAMHYKRQERPVEGLKVRWVQVTPGKGARRSQTTPSGRERGA